MASKIAAAERRRIEDQKEKRGGVLPPALSTVVIIESSTALTSRPLFPRCQHRKARTAPSPRFALLLASLRQTELFLQFRQRGNDLRRREFPLLRVFRKQCLLASFPDHPPLRSDRQPDRLDAVAVVRDVGAGEDSEHAVARGLEFLGAPVSVAAIGHGKLWKNRRRDRDER